MDLPALAPQVKNSFFPNAESGGRTVTQKGRMFTGIAAAVPRMHRKKSAGVMLSGPVNQGDSVRFVGAPFGTTARWFHKR